MKPPLPAKALEIYLKVFWFCPNCATTNNQERSSCRNCKTLNVGKDAKDKALVSS